MCFFLSGGDAHRGAWVLPGPGVVVPGVGEGGGGAPLRTEPLPRLKRGLGWSCAWYSPYPRLSWVQGFAIACFVVMSIASLTCCHCCWSQTWCGAPDCPPELEIVKILNVVRASKDICSDQLEELLTVRPIFPAIKISCTNCLR